VVFFFFFFGWGMGGNDHGEGEETCGCFTWLCLFNNLSTGCLTQPVLLLYKTACLNELI
jgi:hypothetical protein